MGIKNKKCSYKYDLTNENSINIEVCKIDAFKKVIFFGRSVAYHKCFVRLGSKSKQNTLAFIWNEAISGRNEMDLISIFCAFF